MIVFPSRFRPRVRVLRGVSTALVALVVVLGADWRRVSGASTPTPRRARTHLCTLEAGPGNAFTSIGVDRGPRLRARALASPVFNITYVGFDAFPEAREAFQLAADIWSEHIRTPVPINVWADFTPLAPSTLGQADAYSLWPDIARSRFSQTLYPDALADQLRGSDNGNDAPDISATFNSTFEDWYFGTDGNPPAGKYDFVTVVLHELAHGLGFLGSAGVYGDQGSIGGGGLPYIFDRFAATESGVSLLNFTNPSVALGTQLTRAYDAADPMGPGVYWTGAHGVAGNAGVRPRLYTPTTWSWGSSYSHIDEQTFPPGHPGSLMSPTLLGAEVIHEPGSLTLGIFADVGWNARTPVAVRDFNLDGEPDLLFQNTSGQAFAWFMNGTTFSGGSFITPEPGDDWRIRASADFTGDARADLLVQSQVDGAVNLLRMNGTTGTGQQTIPIAVNTPWRIVGTGDLSNDGHSDVIWQHVSTRHLYVWFMKPAGGWGGYSGPGGAFRGDFLVDTDQAVTTPSATMQLGGVADVDDDGRVDLIWQDAITGALSVWYLNETTLVSDGPLSPGAVNPLWRIRSAGDYNDDGHADLIWQHASTGDLYAWFMSGPSLVTAGPLAPSRVNPVWQIVGPR